MKGVKNSDGAIVPSKRANKGVQVLAEFQSLKEG